MKTTATTLAAALAAFLIGLSFAGKPAPPVDNSATITSLEFEVKSLQEEVLQKANEIAELKARKPEVVTETIRVRDDAEIDRLKAEIAGLRKAAASPYDPIDADDYDVQKKSRDCAPAAVYQQRRRLFGRFR